MTFAFHKGQYGVRLAKSGADLEACQALRHQCFYGRPGRDAEPLDDTCKHLMIASDAQLVGTCRFKVFDGSTSISKSYAARRYDMTALARRETSMLELGRVCALSGYEADTLRLMWAALTRIVDDANIAVLFGCASFIGADPKLHKDALALLAARHIGPPTLRPAPNPAAVQIKPHPWDQAKARCQLPPLLRGYLGLGGWVSDHAVEDPALDTLHVFCAVETDLVPAHRAKALRAMAV